MRSFLARLRHGRFGGLIRRSKGSSAKEIFRHFYHSNYWGNEDSRSGGGSDLTQTVEIRNHLPSLLKEFEVQTMLDIPCGDWHWMKEVEQTVEYIGADIVSELIEVNQRQYGNERVRFLNLDMMHDDLPAVDLVMSRDVLVHFSFNDIFLALRNLRRSGAKYLLTTTFTNRSGNTDIATGQWRPLNLEKHPFNFPAPLKLINEKCTEGDGSWGDKSLGLWRIQDIGHF